MYLLFSPDQNALLLITDSSHLSRFMDEEQVGKNRNLMKDFIALANKNKYSSASICFLISLNQFGESNLAFQLKLLKRLYDIPTTHCTAPLCEVNMNFIGKCFGFFFHLHLRIKSKASAYMQMRLDI